MNRNSKRHLWPVASCSALALVMGCMQDGSASADGDPQPDFAAQTGQMQHDAGTQNGGSTMDAGMSSMADGGSSAHPGMNGMQADGGLDEMGDAICPPDFPRFSPARTKAGDLTIKVVSVSPSPPRQRVANDWELEIVDATGAPVSGLSLLNPDSYMAVHGHSGKRRPIVQALAAPGHYLLDNIDFSMRGPWEVLFDVQRPGDARPAAVSLKGCVE